MALTRKKHPRGGKHPGAKHTDFSGVSGEAAEPDASLYRAKAAVPRDREG